MNLYTNLAQERLYGIINNRVRGKLAIIFYLSNLDENHRNEEHVSIAINILKEQLNGCLGDIIVFENGNVFVVFNNKNTKQLENCLFQLKYLFAEDSLLEEGGSKKFYEMFDLEYEWNHFEDICKSKFLEVSNENTFDIEKVKIKSYLFNSIENALDEIPIHNLIFFDPIYINTEKHVKSVIMEMFLDRIKIKRILSSALDIMDNRHLQRCVDDVLDIKMMIALLKKQDAIDGLMVKLSLQTLVSEEFALFDSALKESFKRNIIISVALEDVFSNLRDFDKVRSSLQSRGYKVCLDSIEPKIFMLLDREMLGFDLIKVKYEDDLKQYQCSGVECNFSNKVRVSGSTRIILTNCNTIDSIRIGKVLGILLFQGRSLTPLPT